MATPTPWQIAAHKAPTVKRKPVYGYQPYDFSHITTSNGTNPRVTIPATGPHAIGATPPTDRRQIVAVEITVVGTNASDEYGNNLSFKV